MRSDEHNRDMTTGFLSPSVAAPWPAAPLLRRWPDAAGGNCATDGPVRDTAILNAQAYGTEPLLCDAALVLLLSIFSGVAYRLLAFGKIGDVSIYAGAGFLVSVLFCGILRFKGLRRPFAASVAFERARDGLSAWISAFGLFFFVMLVMKTGLVRAPGAVLMFFLSGACGILLSRTMVPLLLRKVSDRHALDGGDVIIVGPDQAACLSLLEDVRDIIGHAPHFINYDANCSEDQWRPEVARVLGVAQKQAHEAGPGEILVMGSHVAPSRLNDVLDGLARLPRPICIIPDDRTASVLRQSRAVIGKTIALEFQRAPLNAMQRALKRSIDLVLATAALAALAPLLAVIAIAIKCDSPGPVMFRQSRTGYRGRIFRIFKFRTMTVLEDGPAIVQACRQDKRVTRIGRFLRRSSLDELPQIFNVIAGDMSLVGPRPHAVVHDKDYEARIPNYTLRQHILPGITGWAQVNGCRGETATPDAMHKRVEHDIWYLRNCSIGLDVKILARTVFEIMRARNAY